MSNNPIIEIQSTNQLEELMTGKEPIILYFSLDNCNVCEDVLHMLMELVDDTIKVGKIDINEQKEIAGQRVVFTVPTILIFNEGRELLRESRFIDFNNIKRLLDNIK